MNCAFDKEKLTGYYDGELGVAEKAEVERHIASCSECLRDLGELKSAALLVKELPRLRAPASIAAGVSREIQAAGKLHLLAKFRRTVLWAAAAAAGLFVAMNAMYFSAQRQDAPTAARAPLAPTIARVESLDRAAEKAAPSAANAAPGQDRFGDERLRQDDARRNLAARKDAAPVAEEQKQEAKSVDALKKADPKPEMPAEKTAAPEPKLAAATPAPAAPAAPPPAPGAPKPDAAPMALAEKGEAAKPVLADKEREARKADSEAAPAPAAKAAPTTRGKAAALDAPAELPPIHCTLSAIQLAKARPRMEDALKKMGIAVPAPAPAIKSPRPLPDNVFTIEISDSQLAALREELEKAGDAKLMQSYPVDPVLPQFRPGGLFGGGAKKEAQAGAAVAGGKAKTEAKDKDGKEAGAAEAPAEPRRKVTLHLVEVKTLPADADDRPLKK